MDHARGGNDVLFQWVIFSRKIYFQMCDLYDAHILRRLLRLVNLAWELYLIWTRLTITPSDFTKKPMLVAYVAVASLLPSYLLTNRPNVRTSEHAERYILGPSGMPFVIGTSPRRATQYVASSTQSPQVGYHLSERERPWKAKISTSWRVAIRRSGLASWHMLTHSLPFAVIAV